MGKFNFEPGIIYTNKNHIRNIVADIAPDLTDDEIEEQIHLIQTDKIWISDTYQVNVRYYQHFIHLSIKRRDKAPIHDWRDLQQIKNVIVGTDYEAVELYPAEERVVDTANQYHLWVMNDPTYRFPFGFNQGLKSYISRNGAVQRPMTEE